MENESLIEVLKRTFQAWNADRATRLAAALSFYAIFSLAPLVIILIAVIGSILDQNSVQQMVVTQLQANIGEEGASFITSALKNDTIVGPNLLVTMITVLSLIAAAIGIFVHLKTSFNIIWNVEGTHSNGLIKFIKENAISFLLVIIIGVLFVVSLILSATITFVSSFFRDAIPYPQVVVQLLNQALTFGIMTVLFATIFKLLPDKKVQWSDVWEGSLFTATLFIVGKFFIGFYISHTAVASKYGAAGSLIVIMLWVYYSTQILFFGAEFTKIFAYTYGSFKKESQQKVSEPAKVVGSFIDGFIKGVFNKKSH